MLDSNLHSARWLGVAVGLLVVMSLAACGDAPAPTPTPVPEPTPVPTPAPEPTAVPEPAQPAMALEDLRITAATTGQDLVAHLSQAEAGCISAAMGDANFQLFQGAPLVLAVAATDAAKPLLAACLVKDNLLVLGVGLMSANLGGWSDDAIGCATGLARSHPEFIHAALGVESGASDPSHPDEIHGILLDVYECFGTAEQAAFQVAMMSNSLEASPFTGQDLLAVLPESEVECLQANLPEPVFAMIANAPSVAGGELSAAPPQLMACISPESLGRIPAEVMVRGMGASSDESQACVVEFISAHSHYIELVRAFQDHAKDLSEADFLEIAEDGFKLFSCLTDEELAQFQQTYLPYLLP